MKIKLTKDFPVNKLYGLLEGSEFDVREFNSISQSVTIIDPLGRTDIIPKRYYEFIHSLKPNLLVKNETTYGSETEEKKLDKNANDYLDSLNPNNELVRYHRDSSYKVKKTLDFSKKMILSSDPVERKGLPITEGVLDYFPLAIAEVSKCSKAGNEQHNKGKPLHWDKSKSTDHANCISRHLIDRGSFDEDGVRHSAKLAWRALALLQTELENEKNR